MKKVLVFATAALCLAVPVFSPADWFPDNPDTKWAQLPDLDPTGIDVNCSPMPVDFVLADDFECRQTGPLTGIHIWGSWLDDFVPDPSAVGFTLSIHADIPADQSGLGYSTPGELLWMREFMPGEFMVFPWAEGILEGWLDPPEAYFFPADTICWQYNFTVPEPEAFVQEGQPDSPVVYWLDVKAFPLDSGALFGWKTSLEHWNDDAVWGSGQEPYAGPWFEMIYPPMHELAGQSIDLAFALTGPQQQEALDWGDAPDPAYPTLAANNGANHVIVPGIFMGAAIDGEPDGQPDPAALGDDNDGNDDEDGVVFPSPLLPGQLATADVTVSAPGMIDAWIDFDQNGSWAEPGEQILVSVPVNPGTNSLQFIVPGFVGLPGQGLYAISTCARFRYSTAGGLSFAGSAPDGEVEDYLVDIPGTRVMKWEQRPDLGTTGFDVAASPGERDYILADDFLCTATGPLTDFDIYGSWRGDILPLGDPTAVAFTISIHADIPADQSPTGYSMPGELLWMREIAPDMPEVDFVAEPYAEQIEEGWLDPPDLYAFPADWTCWRYSFHIDPHLAFRQMGTPAEPVVYWIDLKAFPFEAGTFFGWKTTLDHWNDDAVWGEGPEPGVFAWYDLIYPPQHQFAGDSVDLAFTIWEDTLTGVPGGKVPERTGLRQNAPNPFNPRTEILCTAPAGGGRMRLDVFDARGRMIRTLIDEHRAEGEFTVFWDGCDRDGRKMPAGIYFSRLTGPEGSATVKMTLVK